MSIYTQAPRSGSTPAIIIKKSRETPCRAPSALPVPPPELMQYGETVERHLADGRREFEGITHVLERAGFSLDECRHILDFGCGNARVMRWMAKQASEKEVWGCDIRSDLLLWALENLSPPFRFFVSTTVPHLPFQDGYFDLVMCNSVFTHLTELHLSWLLELRRIISDRGLLYVTLHDERYVQRLEDKSFLERARWAKKIQQTWQEIGLDLEQMDFLATNLNSDGMEGQVFVSEHYFRKILPPGLDICYVESRGYADCQTSYLIIQKG